MTNAPTSRRRPTRNARSTTRPSQLFPVGDIETTPTVRAACSHERLLKCLLQHAHGNWGVISRKDEVANRSNLYGAVAGEIVSAYPLDPARPCDGHGDNCLWIITDADRRRTQVLLASDY